MAQQSEIAPGASLKAKTKRVAKPRDPVGVLARNFKALWIVNYLSYFAIFLLIVSGWIGWSAIRELRDISLRLADLENFEERVTKNIDTMNNGLQNRLEKIDQRTALLQSTVNSVVRNSADAGRGIPSIVAERPLDGDVAGAGTAEAPSNRMLLSSRTMGLDQTGAGLPRPSPLFRRVVTPEGKIVYEKTVTGSIEANNNPPTSGPAPFAPQNSGPVPAEGAGTSRLAAIVTRVPRNDTLNVRAGPSTDYDVITELNNGDQVWTLGCVNADGSEWCQIEQNGDQKWTGWVNSWYLKK